MRTQTSIAACVLFLATSLSAMPVGDYIAHLQSIDNALRANRPADAEAEARSLLNTTIDAPGGAFTADASLLNAIINDRTVAETRVAVAIAELRKAAPGAQQPQDPNLIDRLRHEQSGTELKEGGDIPQPELDEESLMVRAIVKVEKFFQWLGDKLERLGEWMERFWPRVRSSESGGASVTTRWIVGALVGAIAIVLGVLAWEVVRRSKRRLSVPIAASAPIASKRDEDPLSRGATEWERYASQLAAAGRIREAIRAWYHAVLVTCYAANILHFRKGRTNWEYIAALSPELPWRGDFVRLTRRFEAEWYGRDTSTRDALEECSTHAKHILNALRSRVEAAA